jgi:hypothetical protein
MEEDGRRANFDDAVLGCRALLRPRERGIQVRHIENEGAAELLLGVRERAILNLRRPLAEGERRGRGDRLQDLCRDEHACGVERLRVGVERGFPFGQDVLAEVGLGHFGVVHQQ